jgi:hypothetical protein
MDLNGQFAATRAGYDIWMVMLTLHDEIMHNFGNAFSSRV